jgi:acyl-CoA synthetase (AMP-forming)/AMP-acid ligase II
MGGAGEGLRTAGAARTDATAPVNVARRLDARAEQAPDRLAVRTARRSQPGRFDDTPYAALAERTRRLASGLLRAGLEPGERVCLLVPPGPELIALTFACLRAGIVPVLIDPGMGRRSFLACVERTAPVALVGVRRAHLVRTLFPRAFRSCRLRFGVGPGPHCGAEPLAEVERRGDPDAVGARTSADDPAAILFTSGSTGPAKGVLYTHGIFDAQVDALEALYGLEPGEVDVACFPLFALFDAALGLTSVIPELDPSRPGRCDPARIYDALQSSGASTTFGSPAIWRRVAPWCRRRGLSLAPLRRILIAGAPVPPQLVEQLCALLPANGDVHTPYGATECLPITSIAGRELLEPERRRRAETGAGTCVGRAAAGMEVRAVELAPGPVARLEELREVPNGAWGELLVRGPVVTPAYADDPAATAATKVRDAQGRLWHRMGDLGRIEADGRIWFGGRVAHRLETAAGLLPCVPLENAANTHPAVRRSALVGLGEPGAQRPLLIVEREGGLPRRSQRDALGREILGHTRARDPNGARIEAVLFHREFPTDVRHNAKIRREELRDWAEGRLR